MARGVRLGSNVTIGLGAAIDIGVTIGSDSQIGAARTAAPVVGGLWSCMVLTLLVLPAAYTMWRRHQVRVATAVSLPHDLATTDGAA